jgi:hypothetical protein
MKDITKKRDWWPHEIGNLTNEIARSKAVSKVRGPFMVVCSACGLYYQPNKREEHVAVCCPPEIHLNQLATKRAGIIRIYDIAKKHGLENKEVLAVARKLGIASAKSPSSSLDGTISRYLEEHIIARQHKAPIAKTTFNLTQ